MHTKCFDQHLQMSLKLLMKLLCWKSKLHVRLLKSNRNKSMFIGHNVLLVYDFGDLLQNLFPMPRKYFDRLPQRRSLGLGCSFKVLVFLLHTTPARPNNNANTRSELICL
jgi:hypothetical protein